ncbi:MAG: HEAT repeat domain-containing protein [Pseudomonadota bacterium]
MTKLIGTYCVLKKTKNVFCCVKERGKIMLLSKKRDFQKKAHKDSFHPYSLSGSIWCAVNKRGEEFLKLLRGFERQIKGISNFKLLNLSKRKKRVPLAVIQLLSKALNGSDFWKGKAAARTLTRIGKASVPTLIRALKSRTWWIRLLAAQALGSIGKDSHSAIPKLIKLLTDSHTSVRIEAAFALGRIGPKAKRAVPLLLKMLKVPRLETSEAVVFALEKIGVSSRPVILRLIRTLKISRWEVRVRIIECLGQFGKYAKPAAKYLIRALRDEGGKSDPRAIYGLVAINAAFTLLRLAPYIFPQIIKALKTCGDDIKSFRDVLICSFMVRSLGGAGHAAIPYLMRIIKNRRAPHRILAAKALGKIGTGALPILIKVLKSKDYEMRLLGVKALKVMGKHAVPAALPGILYVLRSAKKSDRQTIIETIGSFGFRAKLAIPELNKVLKDPDESIRTAAIEAMSQMISKSTSKILIPIFIRSLTDPNNIVRSYAAIALGKIGSDAKQAIPSLIRVVKFDSDCREAAAKSLSKIGPSAIPALQKLLKGNSSDVKSSAIEALGNIGAKSKVAVADIIIFLNHPSQRLRIKMLEALGKIGKAAKASISVIIKLLKNDQNYNVRKHAASVLVRIDPLNKHSVVALIEALKDKDNSVIEEAAISLGKFATMAKQAIPNLFDLLKHSNVSITNAAVQALGNIGKDAIPFLISALMNESSNIRGGVAEVLGRLGKIAQPSLGLLIRLLHKDSSSQVRIDVAKALGEIQSFPSIVIPALTKALKDPNPIVRKQVAKALSNFGFLGQAAIPSLIRLLGDTKSNFAFHHSHSHINIEAFLALQKIGIHSIPALIKALKSKNLRTRLAAAETLGIFSPHATNALPALERAFKDPKSKIKDTAAEAMYRIRYKK